MPAPPKVYWHRTAPQSVRPDARAQSEIFRERYGWGAQAEAINSPGDKSNGIKSSLAHPSNRVIAQLNEAWRVVDDPLQWIIQRKKGNPRNKSSGWRNRAFCRTREALLRGIREYCCLPDQGELRCIAEYRGVDEVAFQQVLALPQWHHDRFHVRAQSQQARHHNEAGAKASVTASAR